ncbi:MAG: ABC transporter permease [Streptosporangiales bacterium]|nr:ABC transporter permease [Streptosporangiales bacterium]MBO0889920.1 ABC transporter permease [Acidothermales bacterium]
MTTTGDGDTTVTGPSRGGTRTDAPERAGRESALRRVLTRPGFAAIAGAIVVGLFFSFYTGSFATPAGVANWLDPSSTIGIVALPVAMLMIGGEFDLSAGVMIGSSGLVMGLLAVEFGMNVWAAMVVALLFALGVGLFNGFLVVRTRLPSFIVTLGTFFALQGLNLGVSKLITNTVRVADIDAAPAYAAPNAILGGQVDVLGTNIYVAIFWWIGLTALASWVLTRTKFGNWVFAVGGDRVAARNVGVPVARTKITLFMLTSAGGWFVGMITALRLTSVQASEGVGQELIFIVAAVVGGCLLTGGYGSAFGASVGALIFGMAELGIPYAGWNSDWFYAFLGGILLLAVLINNLIRRRFSDNPS